MVACAAIDIPINGLVIMGLTAALTGITAAVVGVILNLAVWFGWHVVLPPDGGVNGGSNAGKPPSSNMRSPRRFSSGRVALRRAGRAELADKEEPAPAPPPVDDVDGVGEVLVHLVDLAAQEPLQRLVVDHRVLGIEDKCQLLRYEHTLAIDGLEIECVRAVREDRVPVLEGDLGEGAAEVAAQVSAAR